MCYLGGRKNPKQKKNRERVNTLPQNITEPMSTWFLCCLPQQAEIFLFMKYSIIIQQQNPITPTISYSSELWWWLMLQLSEARQIAVLN